MSRFFHRKDQRIEDFLAPYDENKQVEPCIEFTRQEAIDFAKKHIPDAESVTDDKCWEMMAEGRRTDKDGNIYSTYNPDSKWDWWKVGGRFSKQLQVGTVLRNEARIKDIDFSKDEETYEDALDFWDVVIDGKPKTPGKNYFTLFSKKYLCSGGLSISFHLRPRMFLWVAQALETEIEKKQKNKDKLIYWSIHRMEHPR